MRKRNDENVETKIKKLTERIENVDWVQALVIAGTTSIFTKILDKIEDYFERKRW